MKDVVTFLVHRLQGESTSNFGKTTTKVEGIVFAIQESFGALVKFEHKALVTEEVARIVDRLKRHSTFAPKTFPHTGGCIFAIQRAADWGDVTLKATETDEALLEVGCNSFAKANGRKGGPRLLRILFEDSDDSGGSKYAPT